MIYINYLLGFKVNVLIFLMLSFSNIPNQFAQNITNYTFTASNGTFTPLIAGTTNPGQGSIDDGAWNSNPIGFDFWYMGVKYSSISASTNGWLAFGASISSYGYVNGLTNTSTTNATLLRPIIAPLWDDLAITSSTSFTYQTSGISGSRIFTAEYLNEKWQYAATSAGISFQVKLYEGTGKVEFIYRSESGSLSSSTASIGITGNVSGSFLSLNGTGTNPGTSSTIETAGLNSKPATGQMYSFAPPVPTDPGGLTFNTITGSSMTLNWVDNATNEVGYLIYRSNDGGITYDFITQTAANSTTSAQSGLLSNYTYYWKVYAVSEGAISLNSANGNQATPACLNAVTTRTWVGAGNGGSGTDFNAAANWNPAGTPTCADSLYMPLTSGATIGLSSSIEVGAVNATISGANNVFRLNTGANIFQINQTATFKVLSGNGSTQLQVNAENNGTIIYNKSATFSAVAGNVYPISGIGSTSGKVKFKGNVTFNAGCTSNTLDQPATVIFDAIGTQTLTCNNTGYFVFLGRLTTEIGGQNSPAVIITGSTYCTPYGNLNINNNSVLDISTNTLNRYSSGGSINMAAGSILKLGAGTGGQTGSNFPSNFTTFAFNANSTIIYNSASGINQTVFALPTYGNLIFANSSGSGSSCKTATANLTISGNLVINDAYTIFNAGTSLSHILQGNWINNGMSSSGSFIFTTANTLTFNGASTQQIQGSASTTFYNLTLNNSNGILLSPSAGLVTTVKNTLSLINGKITLGNYELAIGANSLSGNISGYNSSNYIITNGTGTLNQYNIGTGQRISAMYPIGINSSSYTPVIIDVAGSTTVDNFKAKVNQNVLVTPGGTSFTSDIVDRTWDISEGTSGGSNVTLNINWNASEELTGFDRTNCVVSHYTGGSWMETSSGSSAGAGPLYSKISGIVTSFSPFGVGTAGGPLPIELLNFNGKCNEGAVRIEWNTISETNNDYFTIEKSTKGIYFEPIGIVYSAGNSSSLKKYLFNDPQPITEMNYYRLKQTDYNGDHKYSDIISISVCSIQETSIVNIYNVAGTLTLDINSANAANYEICIYEITGRRVFNSEHYLLKHNNELKINSESFSTGIYFLVLRGDNQLINRTIVLK
jgi:hypothetical protein